MQCNASRDKVSLTLIEQGNFDTRLSSGVCDRLSEMEKKSWEDYRWKKHQLRKEAFQYDITLPKKAKELSTKRITDAIAFRASDIAQLDWRAKLDRHLKKKDNNT